MRNSETTHRYPVTSLTRDQRADIRCAVHLALRFWPNAGGDYTPRQNIRSAFRMLRSHAAHYGSLYVGIGAVERDAYAHADM